MSNLFLDKGIVAMLRKRKFSKPMNKNKSYRLKSRSWMRRLNAADKKIERLEAELECSVTVTDRQLADMVNDLRDVAFTYKDTQQLREQIAKIVKLYVREQVKECPTLGLGCKGCPDCSSICFVG